ncbi:spermidine hydroxycinnamoyl transferase [Ziziphus jujuba]|uniref:Spermidine hydroxycinnamoyl transferase n=1 Tax=Ziziphus jujuba TaxID=326968 RepID=A0ABM4AI45_ZIZJJ|nr:spermidine hydroxycinnamoyl transferase [Ziziphus jujuba]
MEVKLKSSLMIKPVETTWKGCLSLSEWDQIGFINHIPTTYFYQLSPTTPFDDSMSNTFKESLSRALVPFYPLAGHLRRISRGRLVLNCNAIGVQFIEAESKTKLEEFDDFSSSSYLSEILGQLSPPIDEQPLFLVKFTRFSCESLSLGLTISHVIVDGLSTLHFITEWAQLARGEPFLKIPFLVRKTLRVGDPLSPLSNPHVDRSDFHHPPLLIGHSCSVDKRKKKCAGALLKLSQEHVAKLKLMANEGRNMKRKPYTRYEILAGFIWRCACKARKLEDEQPTSLGVCANLCKRMRTTLLAEYFSNTAFIVTATSNAGELKSKPLGFVVSKVREAIEKVTKEYVWSAIDYLKSQPDLTKFQDFNGLWSCKGPYFGNPNVVVMSWMTLPVYGLDFGWGNEIYMDPGTHEHFDGESSILSNPDGDGSLLVKMDLHVEHMESFKEHFYNDIRSILLKFSDVDKLYTSLHLDDKVEALEDLVTIGRPGLIKSVTTSLGGATLGILERFLGGRRRSQQASVESTDAPTYEEHLVERLARSLERSQFTGYTFDQTRRLGAVGFDGSMDLVVALSWLDDMEKVLDEGMQCPDEDRIRIASFMLGAFIETKRLEFETLTQDSMTVSEYERRFRELSEFCPNLVADEVSKKRRFLDGLSEQIALSISGAVHPTYQLMRDAALEVERQALMRKTKHRSYDGLSSGSPSQGSLKRGSFSLGSSGSRGFRGGRHDASGSRFQRGGHT